MMSDIFVYFGTYTRREATGAGRSEGIYIYNLNRESGALTPVGTMSGVENPSFLALNPAKTHLYAVAELGDGDGKPMGGVSAFAVDSKTGFLELLNSEASKGDGPCHLSVDASGTKVLVSNYGSGSVAVLPLADDGSLLPASDSVQHEGSSINPQRQQGPHAHSVNLDSNNRFAYVADLGLDKILIYAFDADAGTITANRAQPWAKVKAGAGPRHFAFHPNNQYAYVINELDSTMTVFAFDGDKGTLDEIQTLSTLPDDFDGTSYCAEVRVHPNGKFVYGSNRGHDSIAVFKVQDDGSLKTVEYTSSQGEFPRNFNLDPSGEWLIAANQNTHNVFVYQVDTKTGKLTATDQSAVIPYPVCVKFLG
ncbi:MAG: lactonase family protein [Litorilinea sp.]